jgi:hypothetical protein
MRQDRLFTATTALVLFVICSTLIQRALCQQSSYNPCQTANSCCYTLNFQQTPGITGMPLSQGYEIPPPMTPSPWGAGVYNVQMGLDGSMSRPGTPNWLYPFALYDVSAIPLPAGVRDMYSSSAKLVALAASSVDGSTVTPHRGNSMFWVNFTTPVCLRTVSLLRSTSMEYRTGVTVSVYNANSIVMNSQSFPWSISVRSAWQNVSYATGSVAAIRVSFGGVGYGALSSVSVCMPSTSADVCGVCGGNGAACQQQPTQQLQTGIQPLPLAGTQCYNASMVNPICRLGTYNSQQKCVPALLNVTTEVCNGVDDDCDGLVDFGAPAIATTCGIGACQNTVYSCANGAGPNATCVPGQPSAEVCNGVDDDCDGAIDNGDVCAHPVDGVAVVPIARCIEGRTSASATRCYAHFGYWNSDPQFTVTREFNTPMNEIAISPEPQSDDLMLQLVIAAAVPSTFAPNVSVDDAFRVPMSCANDAAVIWSLSDGQGHYLEAPLYASTAVPCESDVATGSNPLLPISVYIDTPCVTRDAVAGTCQVSLGYFNPNTDAAAYYSPVSALNSFFINNAAPSVATASMLPPPSIFFPQRVRDAAVATWPCPQGTEVFVWQLQTAGVIREATISSTNVCPSV